MGRLDKIRLLDGTTLIGTALTPYRHAIDAAIKAEEEAAISKTLDVETDPSVPPGIVRMRFPDGRIVDVDPERFR